MRGFERFEYSVATKAARPLAWEVFSDWTRWPQFSDFYQDIRWSKGDPWQEGSRLSIIAVKPIRVTLDHVITMCEPPARVAWIDHAIGVTLEQWVFFDSMRDGGTEIRTWAEFTGITAVIAGRRIKDVLLEFTRDWYDRYAAECDRAAAKRVSVSSAEQCTAEVKSA